MQQFYEWRQKNGRRKIKLNLHSGQTRVWDSKSRFVFMISGTQSGKRLPLDTPIPTPEGWRPMGEIKVDDAVFDGQGQSCKVTFVLPVSYGDCYRITFDDGASIVADAEHQWLTQTVKQRKNEARRVKYKNPDRAARRPQCRPIADYSVLTTEEIRSSLKVRNGEKWRNNHSIPTCGSPQYPEKDLPIPPYTFGAWLGDGTARGSGFTCADLGIVERIRAEGVKVGTGKVRSNQGKALSYHLGGLRHGEVKRNEKGQFVSRGFVSKLRDLGVLENKHIPEMYLLASPAQRLELLRGLMDTDGYCRPQGKGASCEFTSVRKRLAEGVLELCRSLGIKARFREKRAKLNGKDCGPKYLVAFTTDVAVFHLERKASRLRKVKPSMRRRFITNVEPVLSVPCKCIAVNSPNNLYLATKDYIVTHNTCMGPWWLNREINRCGSGDYLAVTASFDLFKLKLLPEIRTVFEGLLNRGRWWAGDKVLELRDPETGKFHAKRPDDPMWGRIILRSAQSKGGLESATAKAAWLDECGMNTFQLHIWEAVQRRLSLHQGRVLGTTTLYNRAWLKKEVFDRWKAGDTTFDVIQFASTVNPAFPQEEYDRMASTLPQWKLRMFYQGLWDTPPGLIYDVFDEDVHTIPSHPIPPEWPRVVSIDPMGTVIVALFWAYDPETSQVHLYDEYYQPYGRTTREHAKAVKDRLRRRNVLAYVGGGPSERQSRLDWREGGVPLIPPPIYSVESGIDALYSMFKGRHISIHKNCVHFRDELDLYSRKLDSSDQPTAVIADKGIHDHCMDAGRYFAAWLLKPGVVASRVIHSPVQIGRH